MPVTKTAKNGGLTGPETDKQAFENMMTRARKQLAADKVMDIEIISMNDADTVLEVGYNGLLFQMPKGVRIPDVPESIVEILDHAHGIKFSKLSAPKAQAKKAEAPPAGDVEDPANVLEGGE